MSESYEVRKARERRSPLATQAARMIEACERSWSSGRCDACGALVDYDTDGLGHLVAYDRMSSHRHRHELGRIPGELDLGGVVDAEVMSYEA
jgi:hypothetical protein